MGLADILELDKPLVLLDLETTGSSSSKDRIVQIGLVKIYPDDTEKPWKTLINPEKPIPEDMTEIHGITNEMVTYAPVFREVAPILYKGLDGCYIGGYNVHFDIDFLDHAFYRIGAPFDADSFELLDAFEIFKHFHPRNLSAAYKHYVKKELHGAHAADIDILATKEVLEAQFTEHPELPRTITKIQKLVGRNRGDKIDKKGKFVWRNDVAVLAFGKHEGKRLSDVPKKYLKWIAYEAEDFSPSVRRIAIGALNGDYPVRSE